MKEHPRLIIGGVAVNGESQQLNPIAAATPPQPPLDELVGPDHIAAAWKCSRRYIERLRSTGHFPKPDLMLGRLPRWRVSSVNALVRPDGREGQS
jgi:hypothetical protein